VVFLRKSVEHVQRDDEQRGALLVETPEDAFRVLAPETLKVQFRLMRFSPFIFLPRPLAFVDHQKFIKCPVEPASGETTTASDI
jgi:hypothetical protein